VHSTNEGTPDGILVQDPQTSQRTVGTDVTFVVAARPSVRQKAKQHALDLAGRLDPKQLHTYILVACRSSAVAPVPIAEVEGVLPHAIPPEAAETASQSDDVCELPPLEIALLTLAMSSV